MTFANTSHIKPDKGSPRIQIAPCNVCFSQRTAPLLQLHDDRYGYKGTFPLIRCAACGHERLEAELSANDLSNLYTNYYPRSSLNLDSFRVPAEATGIVAKLNGVRCNAFRWVPRNVRVLDIGSGFGETLAYHTARGCEVQGVEADENIRRVAEKYGFNVRVGLFNADNYSPDYFDYITMDQVIEHIREPLPFLKAAWKVLKPGGQLVLSTPNAYGWGRRLFGRAWIHWHAPYHVSFFSRKSMTIAAEKAGFQIVERHTVTTPKWLFFQIAHLLTMPSSANIPSAFWSPQLLKPWHVRLRIGIAFSFYALGITHLVTLVADQLGKGDNLLYILRKP